MILSEILIANHVFTCTFAKKHAISANPISLLDYLAKLSFIIKSSAYS